MENTHDLHAWATASIRNMLGRILRGLAAEWLAEAARVEGVR